MIFGNINNLGKEYRSFPKAIQKAIKYLKETDFSKLKEGKYHIQEEEMFAVLQRYETIPKEEKNAEKHEKYVDIQYLLSGEETIGFGLENPKNEIVEQYEPIKERSLFDQLVKENYLIMSKGNFAIFFPKDIHRPGCVHKEKNSVLKVVIKISIDLFN